jgi:YD repeat-containing protein
MTQIIQQGAMGGNYIANKRVDLTYNAAGQFDTITRYASTSATNLVATSTYGYDAAGRINSLTHAQGGTTFAGHGFAYDAEGEKVSGTEWHEVKPLVVWM